MPAAANHSSRAPAAPPAGSLLPVRTLLATLLLLGWGCSSGGEGCAGPGEVSGTFPAKSFNAGGVQVRVSESGIRFEIMNEVNRMPKGLS